MYIPVLIIPVGNTNTFSFLAYKTLAIPKVAAINSKIIFSIGAVLYGSKKKSITVFILFICTNILDFSVNRWILLGV